MSKHSGRPFPAAALAALATLAVLAAAAALTARAGDTDRERVAGRDLTHRQADSLVDPNDESNGRLRREHGHWIDAPLQVEPAIAWTPGGPDAGGGSGDPWEPASEGPQYDRELLPEIEGVDGTSSAKGLSEDRTWVGGWTRIPDGCRVSGPVLWERDAASGSWMIHVLPGLLAGDESDGVVEAVLDGGWAAGQDGVLTSDCTFQYRTAVLWEPLSADVWAPIDLPEPSTAVSSKAWGMRETADLGLVILGSWDPGPESDSRAALWRTVSGAWTFTDLGTLGTVARAFDVNAQGVVVGESDPTDDGTSETLPFVIEPEDRDGDGLVDTWFEDLDADGANDLMQVPADPANPSTAHALNDARELVGSRRASNLEPATDAVHWRPDGAGGWVETLLPRGAFTEGIGVVDINESSQAVGVGGVPGQRGNTESHGALWDLDAGSWSVIDLNDVTEKSRWDLIQDAQGINSCGDIVTRGSTKDETDVVFLLRPRSSRCD